MRYTLRNRKVNTEFNLRLFCGPVRSVACQYIVDWNSGSMGGLQFCVSRSVRLTGIELFVRGAIMIQCCLSAEKLVLVGRL